MNIEYVVCPEHIEDKIESKHHVTVLEARQLLLNKPRIRFAEKGHTEGNDVHGAFGQIMEENKLSSISKADTLEKMGGFWDTHDFTDFDNPNLPDVECDVSCAVPIELELFSLVEKQAKLRGIRAETLVNLWLQQKEDEQIHSVNMKVH